MADVNLNKVLRRRKLVRRRVLEKVGHELVPNGRSTGNAAGDITHGGVVIVADPDGN